MSHSIKAEVCKIIGALVVTIAAAANAQLEYVTNGDGTSVTVTGYVGNVPSVLDIPDTLGGLTVTGIGYAAFAALDNLKSVVIPDTVTSLGIGAFEESGITNVSIPNSITNLPESVFEQCNDLTNISIPDSVVSIGYAAVGASGLRNIKIPGSVTEIDFGAIGSCIYLTNVVIGFGVPYIGTNMFGGSPMVSVTIPASVTNIEEGGFAQCLQLSNVLFNGNAPSVPNASVFDNTEYYDGRQSNYFSATAYYLPGTTGWAEFSSNAMIPAVLWNPSIQVTHANFGVQSNQFGFDVTGTTNLPIAIEACDDLSQSNWVVLHRVTITNGLFHFSEPFQSNSSARFYRIGFP